MLGNNCQVKNGDTHIHRGSKVKTNFSVGLLVGIVGSLLEYNDFNPDMEGDRDGGGPAGLI